MPVQFTNIDKPNFLTYKFRMSPTHVTYANTLRRLIMTGVESVGFRADMTSEGTTTDVTIIQNDTPMTNEMLAHRVGLIPLAVQEPLKWNPAGYTFKLSKTGSQDNAVDVTTADFEIYETQEVGQETIEPRKIPTDTFFKPDPISGDHVLITRLQPTGTDAPQRVEIVAKASLGVGRENARFIPVTQCSYEYTRDSNPARIAQNFERWLITMKKVVPGSIEKSSERYKALEREFNTMEIARTFLQDEAGEPYSFDFTIETAGVLPIPYIVQRACEVGEAMATRFVNIGTAGENHPTDLAIYPTPPSDAKMLSFDFLFSNQDHTLGNLLQTWICMNMMDGGQVTYCGYKIPHPLRDEMLLRIAVKDNDEKTARDVVAQACRGCVALFREMREAWIVGLMGGAAGTAAAAAAAAAAAPSKARPNGSRVPKGTPVRIRPAATAAP